MKKEITEPKEYAEFDVLRRKAFTAQDELVKAAKDTRASVLALDFYPSDDNCYARRTGLSRVEKAKNALAKCIDAYENARNNMVEYYKQNRKVIVRWETKMRFLCCRPEDWADPFKVVESVAVNGDYSGRNIHLM